MLSDFLKLQQFLQTYHPIWSVEALEQMPIQEDRDFFKWTYEILNLSDGELIEFENKRILKSGSDKFLNLLKQIREFEQMIPRQEFEMEKLPQKLVKKMSQKKIHEIQAISQLVKNKKFKRFVDFGGGVGHLCQYLAVTQNRDTLCLDREQDLLSSGEQRVDRYFKDHRNSIKFKQALISKEMVKSDEIKNLISPDDCLLGLHACGSLSNYLIEYSVQNKNQLLNFGCCYHKCDSMEHFNLSSKAELNITMHGLTMAAMSNIHLTPESLEERRKVKRLRYAAHFFLQSKGIKEFKSLGSPNKKLYDQSFSEYFITLSPESEWSKEELEDFISKEDIQKKIHFTFMADFVRGLFARLIEIYILMDRALYMNEHSGTVELVQLFDRRISPRNIAIVGMD